MTCGKSPKSVYGDGLYRDIDDGSIEVEILVQEQEEPRPFQSPGERAFTNGVNRLQWIGAYHQVLKGLLA